jgi:hypothetical protein
MKRKRPRSKRRRLDPTTILKTASAVQRKNLGRQKSGDEQAANIGGSNHKKEMSMAKDELKDLQDRYLEKQKAKVEIEKPRHVENYDAKLKKHKTPPSAGKKY